MIYALAQCYALQHGLKSVNWLMPNAYGPGDSTDPEKTHALNGIIIRLVAAQRRGEKAFEIWGTGTAVREWIYVEDAARILVASIGMAEQVQPVNMAQNKGYSIVEIARMACEALAYAAEFTFNAKYPEGTPVKIMDDERFREIFPGFCFTPIRDGIRNAVDYYREMIEHASSEPTAE
jgi:GDP-L-fucose synthase